MFLEDLEKRREKNCQHGRPSYTCPSCRITKDTSFYGAASKESRRTAMEAVIEFAWTLKRAKLRDTRPDSIERVKCEFIANCRKVSGLEEENEKEKK